MELWDIPWVYEDWKDGDDDDEVEDLSVFNNENFNLLFNEMQSRLHTPEANI